MNTHFNVAAEAKPDQKGEVLCEARIEAMTNVKCDMYEWLQ